MIITLDILCSVFKSDYQRLSQNGSNFYIRLADETKVSITLFNTKGVYNIYLVNKWSSNRYLYSEYKDTLITINSIEDLELFKEVIDNDISKLKNFDAYKRDIIIDKVIS